MLQAIGGAVADTANAESTKRAGINTMIAGLVLQAISLAIFLTVVADFAWRCRKGVTSQSEQNRKTRSRTFFKAFMGGLVLATVLVLIRSIFRVAELWGGFNGPLWNNEIDFLILDGTMMASASILLTALHPGLAFRGQWHAANWSLKKKAASGDDYLMGSNA